MTGHDNKSAPLSQHHLVRPRRVWAGLVLALIGASVLGLGIALLSGTLSVVGALLLLVGAIASLRGGVLHDAVPGFAPAKELRQVRDGGVHEGLVPGEMITTRRARQDAVASNKSTRDLEAAAHLPANVRWAPVAGWLMLLVPVVFTMTQWELVARTATGRGNSFRDTGLAILLGLAGLRVALVPGPHPIAASITLLAGLGLVLGGLLIEHDHTGLAIFEVASGCLALLCAWTTFSSPSSHPRHEET